MSISQLEFDKIVNDLKAFIEGDEPFALWSRWFAMHAGKLAKTLGRTEFLTLKLRPLEGIRAILSRLGVHFDDFFAGDSPPVSNEEYEVMSALLSLQFQSRRIEQLVITDHVVNPPIKGKQDTRLVGIRSIMISTIQDFASKQKDPIPLERRFKLPIPYTLISQNETSAIFANGRTKNEDDGWDRFRQKFPGACGTISLSRVGFGENGEQALIHVGNQCDWLMGIGYYYLLNKTNDSWNIAGQQMTWIS